MLPAMFVTSAKQMMNKPYNICYHMNFDGCSKGNPGVGGAGAVIYNEIENEIWSGSLLVGEKVTNNYSEYMGLIIGLEKAVELNIGNLIVYGDSQLVISQMKGTYKCKSDNLIDLHKKATKLASQIGSIQYFHVLREYNKRADYLSNIPIKEYYSK